MKIAILIPCYNEERTIGTVIQEFRKHLPNAEIYVGDNNSSDKTAEIALKHGAQTYFVPQQGKANVILHLFSEVDADIYIMVDGDNTYPAKHIQDMLQLFTAQNLDMLVGDRLSNGTYQYHNKRKGHNFGNWLICTLINRLFRSKLQDVLTGYRLFSRRFVKNYTALTQGFELEVDLTIFALNYNMKILEFPIEYVDRPKNSQSKLNTFKDGRSILQAIFMLYRLYKPLPFFSILGFFILVLALLLGSLPIMEYIKFSYVYKVPTAILAGILSLVSLLLIVCGLVLDSIMKVDKKNVLLQIRN